MAQRLAEVSRNQGMTSIRLECKRTEKQLEIFRSTRTRWPVVTHRTTCVHCCGWADHHADSTRVTRIACGPHDAIRPFRNERAHPVLCFCYISFSSRFCLFLFSLSFFSLLLFFLFYFIYFSGL